MHYTNFGLKSQELFFHARPIILLIELVWAERLELP
jgi:hypothetical protein